MDNRKEAINALIRKLEQIRDTDEIEEFIICPLEQYEEYKLLDGTEYSLLESVVRIRHKRFTKIEKPALIK
jgi:hypothetical protein